MPSPSSAATNRKPGFFTAASTARSAPRTAPAGDSFHGGPPNAWAQTAINWSRNKGTRPAGTSTTRAGAPSGNGTPQLRHVDHFRLVVRGQIDHLADTARLLVGGLETGLRLGLVQRERLVAD